MRNRSFLSIVDSVWHAPHRVRRSEWSDDGWVRVGPEHDPLKERLALGCELAKVSWALGCPNARQSHWSWGFTTAKSRLNIVFTILM